MHGLKYEILIVNILMKMAESYLTIDSVKIKNDTLAKCNATFIVKDQKTYVDADFFVPFDINRNTAVDATLYVFAMHKWVEAISVKRMDSCDFIKRFGGNYWKDLLNALGTKMHSCVYDKGQYRLRNFYLRIDRLGISVVPKGKLKGLFKCYLKENNQEIAVGEGELTNT